MYSDDILVIFDFDGVIALNTEEITMQVIVDLLQSETNGKVVTDREMVQQLVLGKGGVDLVRTLENEFGVDLGGEIFEDKIMKTRMELMANGDVLLKKDEHLVGFLDALKERGILYFVASSSSRAPMKVAIKALALEEYFNDSNICSIDDYPNFVSKKQLYEEVTKDKNRDNVFVIEDSIRGIQSASNAGIGAVIAYTGSDYTVFNRQYYEAIKNITIGTFNSFKDIADRILFGAQFRTAQVSMLVN